MSYKNIFKRYELKYLMSEEHKNELIKIMKYYMEPDKFGKSTICNIYYDTPSKLLIRHSLEKPTFKEKLRVRSYGVAKKDSTVFIELKKKYKGVVYKRRISMSEQEASSYLDHGIMPEKSNQILNEINYFRYVYKELQPSVMLSYNREAFFGKDDENFRITFDENILMRDYDISLIKGIYGTEILPKGKILMEVKTAMGIPKWLLEFLSKSKIYKTSYSKYGNSYTEIMLPKYLGGTKDVA